MTSPHGGGSTQHDPIPLTPPADPWLAEASTSAVGDTPSMPGFDVVPPADITPFTAAAPLHGRPDEPRPRRTLRWVVVVLAACALFIAGMLAIDQFGSGDDDSGSLRLEPSTAASVVPSAKVTTARRPAAAAPVTSADAGPEVVYEVTASGSRNTGSVSYTDQDGDIIRRNGIPLPWRITFPVGAQRYPLVLIAQRKDGGDAGPVTCSITLNGKLLAATTQTGKYAAPQCSGSG